MDNNKSNLTELDKKREHFQLNCQHIFWEYVGGRSMRGMLKYKNWKDKVITTVKLHINKIETLIYHEQNHHNQYQ